MRKVRYVKDNVGGVKGQEAILPESTAQMMISKGYAEEVGSVELEDKELTPSNMENKEASKRGRKPNQ